MGEQVMVSETHGMSQRGGSVISHLKIGDDQSPLIQRGTADLLLSLNPDEAIRYLPYLRRGGVAFVNTENGLSDEIEAHLDKMKVQLHCIPASQIAVELGYPAVANTVLAGYASSHPDLHIPFKTLREAVEKIATRGLEINLQALEAGFQAGKKTR